MLRRFGLRSGRHKGKCSGGCTLDACARLSKRCRRHRRLSHAPQLDRIRRCDARREACPLSRIPRDLECRGFAELAAASRRIREIPRERGPRLSFEARAGRMIYIRSALFLIWGVVVSVTMNVGFLPILILPRAITVYLARIWARLILWGLKWTAGLDVEIRGRLPDPRVIVAAKHFTMWETVALMAFLHDPAIVLKRQLFWLP